MVETDPGAGGGGAGGGSNPDNDGGGAGGGGLSQRAILAALGIGSGTWATIRSFAESPREFILEIVLGTLVDGILSFVGYLSGALDTALTAILDSLGAAGSPFLSALSSWYDLLLLPLGVLDDTLVTLAEVAGPLSFIATIAGFAIVLVISFGTFRLAIEVIRFI